MAEKGFWPRYEGKHIGQFLYFTRGVTRWLRVDLLSEDDRARYSEPRLVYRRVSNVRNDRTLITAVLPPCSGWGDKLPAILIETIPLDLAATILNSLAADYALRLRGGGGGGANLDFHVLRALPVPAPDSLHVVAPIRSQEAVDDSVYDRENLWPPIWKANRVVAQLYDLTPDDFEHIMGTFDVFAQKHPRVFAYLLGRLQEWKQEQLSGVAQSGRAFR